MILVQNYKQIARFLWVKERMSNSLKKKWFAISLIYPEQPEQITNSCSFVMNNLSNLLTVTHLSWLIRENRSQWLIWSEHSEQMSEWAMSKWANAQTWLLLELAAKASATYQNGWPVGCCCHIYCYRSKWLTCCCHSCCYRSTNDDSHCLHT